MKLYTTVKLKEKIGDYPAGSQGIIIEIYNKTICYVEIFDENGDTIGVLYDVPIEKLEAAK
ncbi:MAG: DUF4926 domain-containing protein [Bacilli bacterium]|nr:DUF4926 domain-containing protein [Bacilli bacterium]